MQIPRTFMLLALVGCGDSDAPPPSLDVVAHFDPAQGQLPEGLAVRDGIAYVGFAPAASVVTVDAGGHVAPYATVPSTEGGTKGLTLGLALDGAGELYVAQASFDPSVVAGVYRVPVGGGAATAPFASDLAMTFPNGLAFDRSGRLFVADSGGAIFTVDVNGKVAEWLRDPLLAGDPNACPGLLPLPIGANGIVVTEHDVWVTNTDHGALVRVPIAGDGTAGAARAVVQDCALAGADGLAGDGSTFLVAVNGQDRIVEVDDRGVISELFVGAPLDFPASIATADEHTAFVTDLAFVRAQMGQNPAPALLTLVH